MQHEDHIERYNHNLESLLKENDLALKTLYEYLKNSSIDNMTMLKKEVYKDYYTFEVNHNIRNFNPVIKETFIDDNIRIIYNENTIVLSILLLMIAQFAWSSSSQKTN